MGGLTKALFGLAPVFTVALIFVLQGRNDVQLQQERHRLQQREQSIIFDKQFDSAFNDIEGGLQNIGNPQILGQVHDKTDAMDDELADTVKRRKQLDAEFNERFRSADAELADAKKSLEETQ